MKLITEVAIPEYPFQIDHQSSVLMMGSCFTDNVGRLLEKYLFSVCVNPFGVTYNPLSIRKNLEALIRKNAYVAGDLDYHNDLWFSFDHYTGFSSPDRDKALTGINEAFLEAKGTFRKAHYLILTWGTAWVYRHNSSGEVVCNCHKIPASEFTRSRLTTREIIKTYKELLTELFKFNPNLKIIQTVSPVRHWKDGAHGNQLSKSTLLLAGETLCELYPDRFFYFPSYELVMDELRDYRFYADDLIHISDQATQYIWGKFADATLSDDSRKIIGELEPLLKILGHRPMIAEGEAYKKLVGHREKKLADLKKKYPDLPWGNLTGK